LKLNIFFELIKVQSAGLTLILFDLKKCKVQV